MAIARRYGAMYLKKKKNGLFVCQQRRGFLCHINHNTRPWTLALIQLQSFHTRVRTRKNNRFEKL